MYWCETCEAVFCGHCVVINGEHRGHNCRTIADKHTELRTHAATLTPRIATLTQQLEEETALTTALRERAEVSLAELQTRTASFNELAVAPYAAQLELLKTFLTQSTARERTAIASANATLGAVDEFKDALSVARLGRLLTRAPRTRGCDGAGADNGDCDGGGDGRNSGGAGDGRLPALAGTDWAAARAAFGATFADAAAAVAPREVTCEADVPLASLTSASAAVVLGAVELCGVRFVCRVRRGCSCGVSPLLRLPFTAVDNKDDGVDGIPSASSSLSSSAFASAASSSLAVEGAQAYELAPCACALVGEVDAQIMSTALAAQYKAYGTRAKTVAELIDTSNDVDGDNDTAEDGAGADPDADSGAASGSSSAVGDTDTTSFGTVRAVFTLADGNMSSAATCNVVLTDQNKLINAVALAKHAELSAAHDNVTARVRVRCVVSFPDVFQQARALQLLCDALPGALPGDVQADADAKRKQLVAAETELNVFAPSSGWLEAFNAYIMDMLAARGFPSPLKKDESASANSS